MNVIISIPTSVALHLLSVLDVYFFDTQHDSGARSLQLTQPFTARCGRLEWRQRICNEIILHLRVLIEAEGRQILSVRLVRASYRLSYAVEAHVIM